jgi:hypothetical protein
MAKAAGHHRATGMGFRHRLEVVSFIGVTEHAMHQRSVDRRGPDIRGDDRGLCRASLSSHKADCHFSGLEFGPGHHGAERVQDAMLGFTGHVER